METYTGRITKDALKRDVSGKIVINFTIAKNRRIRQNGEAKERTTYIDCSYWNVEGLHPHLTKGTVVEVSGETGVRAYINNDGIAVGVLTLFVRDLIFHGGTKKPDNAPPSNAVDVPDDLPF